MDARDFKHSWLQNTQVLVKKLDTCFKSMSDNSILKRQINYRNGVCDFVLFVKVSYGKMVSVMHTFCFG